MTPVALQAEGLTLGYDRMTVFENLDLSIAEGTVTTLIGANGSGKSTLLKAFGRLLAPTRGTVRLAGTPIAHLSTRAVARRLAVLPQKPLTPAATTVGDLVMRGRHPHQSLLRPWTPADAGKVAAALAATGLEGVADRDVNSLSGGQLQRAWIALVLAQETPVILLDEPTTFLDLAHQLEVLRLVRSINRERGSTIVMVLHDLGLAARYSDRLVVLGEGGVLADGEPWQVLTPELLATAFGLAADVIADPSSGTPLVVPLEPVEVSGGDGALGTAAELVEAPGRWRAVDPSTGSGIVSTGSGMVSAGSGIVSAGSGIVSAGSGVVSAGSGVVRVT